MKPERVQEVSSLSQIKDGKVANEKAVRRLRSVTGLEDNERSIGGIRRPKF